MVRRGINVLIALMKLPIAGKASGVRYAIALRRIGGFVQNAVTKRALPLSGNLVQILQPRPYARDVVLTFRNRRHGRDRFIPILTTFLIYDTIHI